MMMMVVEGTMQGRWAGLSRSSMYTNTLAVIAPVVMACHGDDGLLTLRLQVLLATDPAQSQLEIKRS